MRVLEFIAIWFLLGAWPFIIRGAVIGVRHIIRRSRPPRAQLTPVDEWITAARLTAIRDP